MTSFMASAALYGPQAWYLAAASGGGSANSSLSAILSAATEFVTWVITTMTSYLTFVTSNPVILVFFIITIAGAGIGFLMRIWHSA